MLFRSTQAELVSQADPITEAAPEVDPRPAAIPAPAGRPFVSSTWPLLLDEVFAGPSLDPRAEPDADEVLGPMAHFTHTFLWSCSSRVSPSWC